MFNFNKEKAANELAKRIRIYRKSKFEELDVQYLRAVETGDIDLQTQIVQEKQKLRDMPNIDTGSFQTRDELLSLWDSGSLGEYPYKFT